VKKQMKKIISIIPLLIIISITFYSCEQINVAEPSGNVSITSLVGGYEIILLDGGPVNNGDGTYTWTWSVTNTNPEGGIKDLSHWDFDPGACLVEEDVLSVMAGNDPSEIDSVLEIEIQDDPSMDCGNGIATLKFDYGTEGSDPSYYQLVINKNYEVDPAAVAYWKAGQGCGEGIFDGIGCLVDPGATDCTDETAWADGERYIEQGNWATYTSYVPDSDVPLYAGQTLLAGNVHFSAVNNNEITIEITLYSNWSLQDVDEPVKIQDYEIAPSGNPLPGLFDYKFDYLTGIVVPANNFYGVHLDVQYCEELSETNNTSF
jgi:hypothetical protein